MSESQLCPKCKHGHLRDAGGVTIKREIEPPYTQTGSIRERICDQCGHRQVNDALIQEYAEPTTDKASGTVTRIDPQDKIEE